MAPVLCAVCCKSGAGVLRVARLRDVRARVMRRLVSDRMCRAVKCRWRTDPALAVVGLVAGGGKNRSVRASIGAEALVTAAHPDDVAPKHRHPYGARCALVLTYAALHMVLQKCCANRFPQSSSHGGSAFRASVTMSPDIETTPMVRRSQRLIAMMFWTQQGCSTHSVHVTATRMKTYI